jgi:phage terminase Nu1 subunit (DNA packaging protein)
MALDQTNDAPANLSEVARHLLLTREMIRRLVAERIIERRADGSFDLDQARHAYIRHLRDRRSEKSEAEAALQRAKAKEIELRVAERAHELIESHEAAGALDDVVGVLVSELTSLPVVATRDLAMRRHLDELIRGIRQRAVDRIAVQVESLRGTGKAVDPGGAHPKHHA